MNLCQSLVSLICLGLGLPAAAFDLQGHRGARGHAPENTLPAFERALQIGVSTLELDIGISADGVPIYLADLLEIRKVMDETGVNHAIRAGDSIP